MLNVPDPSTVRTPAELGDLLRALRRREARTRHGRELTHTQISERMNVSAAIIGYYLAGTVLPPSDRFDALVRVLGADRTELAALATARDRVADARREPAPAAPTGSDVVPVPRELPAQSLHFVGRDHELARLDAAAAADELRPVVVSGMAGVGKTALVLRWAHAAAERFPGGQLFADLHGYDSTDPVDPGDVLTWFLHSLGVSPDQVPREPERRATRYRTLAAGRRMLIVLDNARTAEQVRPLLPGGSLCTVVVTSRDSLGGLVAGAGATRIRLDALSAADSARLLRRLVGDRVDATPVAVTALTDLCGGLPLVIRVAAEVVAQRPVAGLAEVVEELRAEPGRLDMLDLGDARTAVRSVLSWSYRSLSPPAARLFPLLGCAPPVALAAPAVAGLGGLDPAHARRLLAELVRAHMVTESSPGRYTMHDLLREYAADIARSEVAQRDRLAAAGGLLDHYLHTAISADRLLEPFRTPIEPVSAGPAAMDPTVGVDEARAWFAGEHEALVAMIRFAVEQGQFEHAWQLCWAVTIYFDGGGHWLDLAAVSALVLGAVVEPTAAAHTHMCAGRATFGLGLVDAALDHYARALEIWERSGDATMQAGVHTGIGRIYGMTDRVGDALSHFERARTLWANESAHNQLVGTLGNIGYAHALLGDHQRALEACRGALALAQQLGDQPTEARTWDSLGLIHRRSGELQEAITCYRTALDLHRRYGRRIAQADGAIRLGDVLAEAGQRDEAEDVWIVALTILDELGRPEAEHVRARIETGTPSSWSPSS